VWGQLHRFKGINCKDAPQCTLLLEVKARDEPMGMPFLFDKYLK